MRKQQKSSLIWDIPVEKVMDLADPFYIFQVYKVQLNENVVLRNHIYSNEAISSFQNFILSHVLQMDICPEIGSKGLQISALCSVEIEKCKDGKFRVLRFGADWFDSKKYVSRYNDISASNVDPVYHFLVHGYLEGRYTDCNFHPKHSGLEHMRGVYELVSCDDIGKIESFFDKRHLSDFALAAQKIDSVVTEEKGLPKVVSVQSLQEISEGIPIVSFVIPCYAQADFLEDVISSIANSTSRFHECLVIDDGNTSASEVRKIRNVSQNYVHQTIKILNTRNFGLAAARNTGIQHAVGKYVKFIDSDDLLVAGSVDNQIEIIEGNNLDGCVGGYAFFGIGFGRAVKITDIFEKSRKSNGTGQSRFTREFFLDWWEEGLTIPIHSLLVKRQVTPMFDEHYKSKEDLEYWLRLMAPEIRLIEHFDIVAIYRMHKDQMSRGSKSHNGFYFWSILDSLLNSGPSESFQSLIRRKMEYLLNYYGESAKELYLLNGNKTILEASLAEVNYE